MKTSTEARKGMRRRSRRRMAIGLNVIAALSLAALLVAMVNYLSYRYYLRGDWSSSHFYSISEKTDHLLQSLTNDVDVIVFFQRGQRIYSDVENLLQEYQTASRRIRVEYVDPDRDLARTEVLIAEYGVSSANVVIFIAGGRSKFVTAEDIVDYDYSYAQYGQMPREIAFKGEQAFSSAIQSITQAKRPIVYFLAGHGEKAVDDFDQYSGYSGIAKHIERDNVAVRTLNFGEMQDVPQDADALIIAGPMKRLAQPEADLIAQYLERNGRVLFLLDAVFESGLDALLEDWGIVLGRDLVVDASRTLTGRELFVSEYGSHPICEPLAGITTIFYLPRSVRPLNGSGAEEKTSVDKPRVTLLASSSESGWAETDVDESPLKYDAARDRPGPVPVAAAAEKGPALGMGVRIRPTRMVVVGDSDFAANGALSGGNLDFFMNSLNWLLEREELMAIAPKTYEESRLILSGNQLTALLLIAVAGMPLAIAVIGAFVWAWRRK
ncbi:MAG: GldG family protein [Verrucomicrobia bacterium]|nr:GldG family protein [Verrucomicrobiota bacterium]